MNTRQAFECFIKMNHEISVKNTTQPFKESQQVQEGHYYTDNYKLVEDHEKLKTRKVCQNY